MHTPQCSMNEEHLINKLGDKMIHSQTSKGDAETWQMARVEPESVWALALAGDSMGCLRR